MPVIKRNGKTENFDFDKIVKVVTYACENAEDRKQFLDDLKLNLKTNMTTREIQRVLVQLAIEKTTVHSTKWDSVASKLYLYNLIKEASINRGYKVNGRTYGNFYDLIQYLTKEGLYHESIIEEYTKEQIDELGEYLRPERDFFQTYGGIKTLAERYLIKGLNKEILELPQEAYMGVAMFLALAEKTEYRVKWAKEFYDTLSKLEMIVATPTMSNARKPFHQLSSCFIGMAQDSLESIYTVNNQFAQVSKYGGGYGLYLGKIRAQNSDIRGFKNTSGGVIPWIKIYNDTAVAVDQLGVRAGAASITLDVWHRDIFDFLQLKTNTGDERRKAHDIFPAVSIPDVFMEQLKAKGKFYLFCPHEIRTHMGWSLEDSWGEEFTKKYWECVENTNLPRVEVKAVDILKDIIKSTTETGTPFLFFRDTVNRMNPNKHAGMIYSSNLCTEIAQNMSPIGPLREEVVEGHNGKKNIVQTRESGDFVVCNLSSINLGRIHTTEDLKRVVPLAVRMMDNVISLNFYPTKEAEITNRKYRAVGLGTYGYHHMLCIKGATWESDKHIEVADKVFEDIAYFAIKASNELAMEKGNYQVYENSDWNTGAYFDLRNYTSERWTELKKSVMMNGMRNSYLMAVAPNGSSAIYGGGETQSIDPVYDKFYLDEKKNSIVPMFAPEISKYFWLYKEAHLMDQKWSIKANGARQKHIDQAQSFNLYITPETTSAEIAKLYMLAWTEGMKTIYYTRSRSVEVEDCLSCSV